MKIIFSIYDEDGNGSLDYSEFRSMIRDMAAGELHVNAIIAALGITRETSVDLSTFVTPATLEAFKTYLLRTRDLLPIPCNDVLNGQERHNDQDYRISMEAVDSMHSKVFLDLSVSAAKLVVTPPDDIAAPNLLQAAKCASLPMSHTVLPYTRRKDDMFSESDWRGLLVDRSAQGFKVAHHVITHSKALMMSLYTEAFDMPDSSWLVSKRTGAAEAMLGGTEFTKENFPQYLQMVRSLCQEAQRIVKAQPMVINCSAPCKGKMQQNNLLRSTCFLTSICSVR